MSHNFNWSVPLAFAASLSVFVIAGCAEKVSLHGKEDALASRSATEGGRNVVFPWASPSVPDGEAVYQRMQCATCHGVHGAPVSGKATVNLGDVAWARQQKPVDQYEFVYFGKRDLAHPSIRENVSSREAWNLVFYVRSLGEPPLDDKTIADVDAVFGSNCAVCHGKKGYGDGPLSKNMEPVPANFQNKTRFYDRTDAVLWDHIANGIKWEGMPNFLGKEDKAKSIKFDDEYIWKLVQYVRHFAETTESTIGQNLQNSATSETKSSKNTVKK
jgi:mono/diheme cytochrome c family protein